MTQWDHVVGEYADESQSAFVRGFIDDAQALRNSRKAWACLNPRSCAASSMTFTSDPNCGLAYTSQSAFVRGFIDDAQPRRRWRWDRAGLNPRSCAASSMTLALFSAIGGYFDVSIRVRARLHR